MFQGNLYFPYTNDTWSITCKVMVKSVEYMINFEFFLFMPLFFPKIPKLSYFYKNLQKCPTFSYTLVPLHLQLRGTLKSDENLSLLYPATWTCEELFHFFFRNFLMSRKWDLRDTMPFFFQNF